MNKPSTRLNVAEALNRRLITSMLVLVPMLAFVRATPAADLVVYADTTITSAPTFDNVLVKSGATLTVAAGITSLGDFTIENGAAVRHAPRDTAGVSIAVADTLHIVSGGRIDVSALGLRGGNNGSAFGNRGETFSAADVIVAGATAGNYAPGASYGGHGARGYASGTIGVPNDVYGVLEHPRHLGSGGAASSFSGLAGGNGGGRVEIVAGTCIVDGAILADGANGVSGNGSGGGGSGGAILVAAVTLGGTGIIRAQGGAGAGSPYASGSGGGGRIALNCDIFNFPVSNVSARGSSTAVAAAAGTIYIGAGFGADGRLLVVNGGVTSLATTPLRTGISDFETWSLGGRARVTVAASDVSPITIDQPVLVSGGAIVTLGTGVDIGFVAGAPGELTLGGGSRVTIQTGATFGGSAGDGVIVQIESGSVLTVSNGADFHTRRLRVAGSGSVAEFGVAIAFLAITDMDLTDGGALRIRDGGRVDLDALDDRNLSGGVLDLGVGCELNVASDNIVVSSNSRIIKDGSFGLEDRIGTLTVMEGGTITHAVRDTAGLQLRVSGILDIRTDGRIDATAAGLRGGNNGSAFGSRGETFSSADAIIGGSTAGNYAPGASYGGYGARGYAFGTIGIPNEVYGDFENPRHLGSGGAASSYSGLAGGNGGGRIRIEAGTLRIDGAVVANGGNGVGGNGSGGGGSGGAITIDAGLITGVGTVSANGGAGAGATYSSGSGGGGRIAIFYDSLAFDPAAISARSSNAKIVAAAGSVYLKDHAELRGDLIVDGGGVGTTYHTPWRSSLSSWRNVTIRNKGIVAITDEIQIENQLVVENGATLIGP